MIFALLSRRLRTYAAAAVVAPAVGWGMRRTGQALAARRGGGRVSNALIRGGDFLTARRPASRRRRRLF
jgi:hypothetical protein